MGEIISFDELLTLLPGGNFVGQGSKSFDVAESRNSFVPPNLKVVDRSDSPEITLISARGATGKSRLAEQISAVKKVPLWLLNRDMAVSGDALRARLRDYRKSANALEELTEDPNAFILIDALDEARMRVSGPSWHEFIQTLFEASSGSHSLILFGRERVLEDIWAKLPGGGVNWFEISHFDAGQRNKYVDIRVGEAQNKESEAYITARDTVIGALAGAVDGSESESFVGYAPVLDAVSLLLERGNLLKVRTAFEAEVGNGRRIEVLAQIIQQLLKREQRKAEELAKQLNLPPVEVYTPTEQIDWLAHHLMGTAPPSLSWCDNSLRGEYANKIRPFIEDHPFRSEQDWASPVFSAYIAAQLFSDTAIREKLQEVGVSTGLLFDFVSAKDADLMIDEWQFAALHSSLMASERHDVEVSASISGPDPHLATQDDLDILTVNGELTLWESIGKSHSLSFEIFLDQTGVIDLKGPLASLSLTFPSKVTVASSSGTANFGPDCFIRCRDLKVSADTVQVSLRQTGTANSPADGWANVTFELAGHFLCEGELVGNPPDDSFEIRLPEGISLGYPWYAHQKTMELPGAEPDERALRFIKMLMNLLRNHGHKGTPAVFDKKLEGRQSIKGPDFRKVITVLQKRGVVTLDGPMIHLAPDWMPHRFSGKEREGVLTFEGKREVWTPVIDALAEAMDQ
ncbi:hypothetical protein [Streptomyces europaeiscabiei]|uniref:hypothetical protein n=1 Tax=Streptomyces europaeiscabiei TaxID=146819 RepID=UPI000A8FE53B|nr:hypothetical protein [Streptomyces europaeiscabiei]MDX3666355.1 hypothetical protein [Streptomyces europaeiscabiei]MDX3840781.1 hypothetical protein [Streptomyces europaeiscabiei]